MYRDRWQCVECPALYKPIVLRSLLEYVANVRIFNFGLATLFGGNLAIFNVAVFGNSHFFATSIIVFVMRMLAVWVRVRFVVMPATIAKPFGYQCCMQIARTMAQNAKRVYTCRRYKHEQHEPNCDMYGAFAHGKRV